MRALPFKVTMFTADWDKHGKSAGPIRNQAMLSGTIGDLADLLIAFPGGRGTEDCIRQADLLGIPLLEVPRGQ